MNITAVRAISWAETASLVRSWLLRAWLLLVAVLGLFVVASVVGDGDRELITEVLSGWLAVYLVPTSICFGILGAAALSSDLDVAADSVLVRAVTRYDFVAGKIGSRLLLVTLGHLAVTVPLALLILKVSPQSASIAQVVIACLAVGIILVFLIAWGALIGAVLGHTLVAIAVLIVSLAAQSLIFDFLGLDYLSFTAFLAELRHWLDGEASAWTQARLFLAFGAASFVCLALTTLVFSRRDV